MPAAWKAACAVTPELGPGSVGGLVGLTFLEETAPSPIVPNDCGQRYIHLNPDVFIRNYSKDFEPLSDASDGGCRQPGKCSSPLFVAPYDPTLIDAARGIQIGLDAPPQESTIRLADIYTDPALEFYGKPTSTYEDINRGQIMYYVNRDLARPFSSPNFVSASTARGDLYKDPMGAVKPQFNRFPIKCENPITSAKRRWEYKLSSIQDTTLHREDLMARQMRKWNEQDFQKRWLGTIENRSGGACGGARACSGSA
jgi:hypothetical protein